MYLEIKKVKDNIDLWQFDLKDWQIDNVNLSSEP